MDLAVAKVSIYLQDVDVLFDYEDTSGDRVVELYESRTTNPQPIWIKLANGEVYRGIYWPSLHNTNSHLFFDMDILKYDASLTNSSEVIVNLPAPTTSDWNKIQWQYHVVSGSSNQPVSIGSRSDVRYMWAYAKVQNLKHSELFR